MKKISKYSFSNSVWHILLQFIVSYYFVFILNKISRLLFNLSIEGAGYWVAIVGQMAVLYTLYMKLPMRVSNKWVSGMVLASCVNAFWILILIHRTFIYYSGGAMVYFMPLISVSLIVTRFMPMCVYVAAFINKKMFWICAGLSVCVFIASLLFNRMYL